MNNIIGLVVGTIYILIILVLSKIVNRFGEEASRKFIHILLCNIWFIYLIFIDNLYVACILPAAFVVINILSYKFKIIKSMEREKNDGYGTIYYAVSILLVTIFSYGVKNPMIGTGGILIMGYGDGLAAILGRKIKSKKYKIGSTVKSIAGSITMFVVSLLIFLILFKILGVKYWLFNSLILSLFSAILEAVSVKGLDNITVPLILTVLTFLAI